MVPDHVCPSINYIINIESINYRLYNIDGLTLGMEMKRAKDGQYVGSECTLNCRRGLKVPSRLC